jgi:hypothetical protein
MSAALIGIVTVIYAGVAISEYLKGDGGMAIVFTGYAFANIGLIWKTLGGL